MALSKKVPTTRFLSKDRQTPERKEGHEGLFEKQALEVVVVELVLACSLNFKPRLNGAGPRPDRLNRRHSDRPAGSDSAGRNHHRPQYRDQPDAHHDN